MADVKLPASGNIRVWFGLENSLSNYLAPTATEINAMLDISDAISWNDFDFGLQASNTIDDPAITALGKVSDLGAAQFGGGMSFYYPKSFTDTANKLQVVYDALDQPRTKGYIVIKLDGTLSTSTPGTAVAGDVVHVFKVMTDGYAESITGEEAFRYTITFLPQGNLAARAVVKSASAIVTAVWQQGVVASTKALTNSTKTKFDAKVDGRWMSNNVTWTISDTTKATVSNTGVVTTKAAGSATLTATYAGGGTAGTCTLTIT
jgi:hypothetical protein